MGNETSQEEKQEKTILRKPQTGEASDFYWSCRNGDLLSVQTIFSSTPFNEINRLEPNGSTGLHAASHFGHSDIVKFLLQNGVFRHRKNRYNLTAYEEAANDQIRELFHRSSSSERFSTMTTDCVQRQFNFNDNEVSMTDDDTEVYSEWVDQQDSEEKIHTIQVGCNFIKYVMNSPILRPMLRIITRSVDNDIGVKMDEQQVVGELQKLIDECITSSHPEYRKACELLSKYDKSRNIDHLLRLYTLETPFYQNLGVGAKNDVLTVPVLIHLNELRSRAFQGCSYRGLTMTHKDLRPYQRASKHNDRVINISNFCSTSTDKDVASAFIRDVSDQKVGVLMVFNFAEKCDTAIQLFTVSEDVPGLSDFEDEYEVLLLPMTLFYVRNIEIESATQQYTIYLENLPWKGGLIAFLKVWWKHRTDSQK